MPARRRAISHAGPLAAIVALAVCGGLSSAQAQSGTDFFKGKTINIIIGSAAAGGFDLYGRLVARHLGKHVPGNPTMVPQNMAGAGTFLAANYLYNIAPRDGTAIGMFGQGLVINDVLRSPGMRFEVGKFNWVGRVTSDMLVTFTWHTSKTKTVYDAMKFETTLGATGAGSSVNKSPSILNLVVGTKYKMILGYPSTGNAILAVERGEVDGSSTGWGGFVSARRDWIKEKKVNLIVQYGTSRHPDLPDLPNWTDLTKTPEDKQLLALFGSNADIGKSVIAPPDMPLERVQILRTAFQAMLKDPAFLEEVKRGEIEFHPETGEYLQKLVHDTISVPETLRERARSIDLATGGQ